MSDAKEPPLTPPDGTVSQRPAPGGNDRRPGAPPGAREIGGRKGPEPTRYGDWENRGIISDF